MGRVVLCLILIILTSCNLSVQAMKWGDLYDFNIREIKIDPNQEVNCDNCFQLLDSCSGHIIMEWVWTTYPDIVNLDSVVKCLRYPKEAVQYQISGKVVLRCLIDKDGNLFCYQLLTELGDSFIKEADRIVHLFRFSKATMNGPVAYEYRITIRFDAPKLKKR